MKKKIVCAGLVLCSFTTLYSMNQLCVETAVDEELANGLNDINKEVVIESELQKAANFGDTLAQYKLGLKLLEKAHAESQKIPVNTLPFNTIPLCIVGEEFELALKEGGENILVQGTFQGTQSDKLAEHGYLLVQQAAHKGNIDAQLLLAKRAEDIALAEQWYKQAAKQNRIEAHFALAHRYKPASKIYKQTSQKKENSSPSMVQCFKDVLEVPVGLSADDTSYATLLQAKAAYELGSYYEASGSLLQAIEHYQKSLTYDPEYVDANYALACLFLTNVQLSHMNAEIINYIRPLLLKAAEQHHVRAQCSLGDLLRHMKQDAAAHSWYTKASDAGDPQASYQLGTMYEVGETASTNQAAVYKDLGKALHYYKLAALKEHPKACAALKRLATKEKSGQAAAILGELCEKNASMNQFEGAAQASSWYAKAIANGHYKSSDRLANLTYYSPVAARFGGEHLAGFDINDPVKDFRLSLAFDCFSRAVAGKNYEALCAIEKLASSAGPFADEALIVLGKLYKEGVGIKKNEQKAHNIFLKSNAAEALYQSSLCYANGNGTERDEQKAVELSYKAASKGHKGSLELLIKLVEKSDLAAYYVAQLYERGLGVAKDLSKAVEWYRKASKSYGPALYALGSLCEAKPFDDFNTVKRNYEEALTWYSRAAEANVDNAADKSETIRSILHDFKLIKPYFRNTLFSLMKPLLKNKAPDFLCLAAHVTALAVSHLDQQDCLMIKEAIEQLAIFVLDEILSRAILRTFAKLIVPEDFYKKTPNPDKLAANLIRLRQICKGIAVFANNPKNDNKFVGNIDQLKFVNSWTQDPCVEMFNCYFSDGEQNFDDAELHKALTKIIAAFAAELDKNLIAKVLLTDEQFNVVGNEETLLKFLMIHHTNAEAMPNRLKSRIVKIKNMLDATSADTRALTLAIWAALGHREPMRAQWETFNFYKENFIAKKARILPLAIRFSLALADFRKNGINEYVPRDALRREFQVAYLEKRLGKALGLVGYKENLQPDFPDLNADYKNGSIEDLKNQILKLCTVDKLVDYIVQQPLFRVAPIPYTEIIRHAEIAQYCSSVFDKATYEVIFKEGKLTESGIKILLVHFGYCEPLNQSSQA